MEFSVHAQARGFDAVADVYERARPGFPADVVSYLVERLDLRPERVVLDLGAGTGKLARLLVRSGARVVAVEPLAAMRATLVEAAPDVEALAGTAEAIPLADASVDAVAVAQAFHWFRAEEALAQIHRVLRPGGALALVWNRRDLGDPLQAAFERIVAPYRGEAPSHRSGAWREAFARTTLFEPLEERTFSHVEELDRDRLVGRAASISFVASLGRATRERVLAEVAELADAHEDRVRFPYVTEVHLTARRDG